MAFRIKELREKKGLTQEQLAELSGVSRATISSLESGSEAVTTTKTLKKLALALGCKVGDFFCNDCLVG